jgi:hypothetical protein
VREPGEKRLLTAVWMVKRLHHEQLPLDSVVGLVSQRASRGHLGIFEHGIPARLLLLHPAPDAFPIGGPSRCSDVVDNMAQPLAQGKPPQARALARPVEQGVALRAQGLAEWYRKTKCGRTVHTALHAGHWIRQMVRPPSRTRA